MCFWLRVPTNPLKSSCLFNRQTLIQAFQEATGTSGSEANEHIYIAAQKWYNFQQTNIFKREILIPSFLTLVSLSPIITLYYYSLCIDKSWSHLIEMILPALLTLLLGIFGTLGCIRAYAYAEYCLADKKIN